MSAPLNILYIEDDSGDIELARMAMDDIQWTQVQLQVIEDGDAAISYIHQCHGGQSSIPDIILLDLNLPKIHGFEVLKAIRGLPICKSVPIIVVSTSNSGKDVEESKALGANAYFTKPTRYAAYKEMFRTIHEHLSPDRQWQPTEFINFRLSLS